MTGLATISGKRMLVGAGRPALHPLELASPGPARPARRPPATMSACSISRSSSARLRSSAHPPGAVARTCANCSIDLASHKDGQATVVDCHVVLSNGLAHRRNAAEPVHPRTILDRGRSVEPDGVRDGAEMVGPALRVAYQIKPGTAAQSRRRGSSTSRRPSPSRFTPSVASVIAQPRGTSRTTRRTRGAGGHPRASSPSSAWAAEPPARESSTPIRRRSCEPVGASPG